MRDHGFVVTWSCTTKNHSDSSEKADHWRRRYYNGAVLYVRRPYYLLIVLYVAFKEVAPWGSEMRKVKPPNHIATMLSRPAVSPPEKTCSCIVNSLAWIFPFV